MIELCLSLHVAMEIEPVLSSKAQKIRAGGAVTVSQLGAGQGATKTDCRIIAGQASV
jgi:hypothetical protein